MEIISGEMLIFGEKLPRHPEFPWLFSATALHKSCEEAIKLRAARDGKDPEKFFNAKRPSEWIKRNITNNEERIEHYANHTRTRIKKYGPNLGFGLTGTNLTVKIDEISSLETVCATTPGRYGGGSYLSLHALRDYATSFSIPELSEAFHKLFPSSSESISSTVKKLSSTRKELEFSKYLAGFASYHKASLETQRPELDKYRVDFCFKSKSHGVWFIEFDENHHEAQVEEDIRRWKEIQEKYEKRKDLPKCGLFFTRVKEGDEYAFLAKFSCYLSTGNLSDLSFIHIASK
jgi:hypothetical protein